MTCDFCMISCIFEFDFLYRFRFRGSTFTIKTCFDKKKLMTFLICHKNKHPHRRTSCAGDEHRIQKSELLRLRASAKICQNITIFKWSGATWVLERSNIMMLMTKYNVIRTIVKFKFSALDLVLRLRQALLCFDKHLNHVNNPGLDLCAVMIVPN